MLFASGLILEREPLTWDDLPSALAAWLRDAGYIAAIGLGIWALAFLIQRPTWARKLRWSPRAIAFTAATVGAGALYVIFTLLLVGQGTITREVETEIPNRKIKTTEYTPEQTLSLSAAGAFALFAVTLPLALDFFGRMRWRRLWALARLSVKEAWSRGIVWICAIIPIIYLYADWYLNPARPEEQLSQRVKIAYFALTLLFVITAILLGSFNIPNDVKNQTIHTIVTKPVERYEIVLGRFVGYSLLLFVEMAALTAVSLLYVTRGMTREAVEESFTARRPVFAKELEFDKGGIRSKKGESVGREWGYRSYIAGHGLQAGAAQQYALWQYPSIPSGLTNQDGPVRLEFTFDIFRTTKGDERVQGVLCTFHIADGRLSVADVEARKRKSGQEFDQVFSARKDAELKRRKAIEERKPKEQQKKEKQLEAEIREEVNAALALKYGVYTAAGVPVADYHTQSLTVPGAFLKGLDETRRKREGEGPALQVWVTMEQSSGPQLLGVARRDLYFLAGEGWFWTNFAKGAAGLWLGACLVLGLALACSTYLSGVISLLTAAFLCGASLFREFITSLAFGRSYGGGPLESVFRLANRQGMVTDLDPHATSTNVVRFFDDI
ncbi:MAG TPA: hypothetical protein VEL76_21370, partial [Gemmataceae bacterium]|nr:hypothetical protein [Gemmataceae bacterium]